MGTFGKYLRDRRMESGMTPEYVSTHSSISDNVLNALENSDGDFFRGQLYFKNFLNEYLDLLKIDREFFFREFSGELESLNKKDNEYIVRSMTGLRYSNFRSRLTIIKWTIAAIIIAALIYFLFIDRNLLRTRNGEESLKHKNTSGNAVIRLNPGTVDKFK